jgi:hypothetical protein
MHYKTDLLTDMEMVKFETKIGDHVTLNVPNAEGGFNRGDYQVTNIEMTDAGNHPESGEHLTQVTLKLE